MVMVLTAGVTPVSSVVAVTVLRTGARTGRRRRPPTVMMRLVVPAAPARVRTALVVRRHVLLLHLDRRVKLRTVLQVAVAGRLRLRLGQRVVLVLVLVVTWHDAKVLQKRERKNLRLEPDNFPPITSQPTHRKIIDVDEAVRLVLFLHLRVVAAAGGGRRRGVCTVAARVVAATAAATIVGRTPGRRCRHRAQIRGHAVAGGGAAAVVCGG